MTEIEMEGLLSHGAELSIRVLTAISGCIREMMSEEMQDEIRQHMNNGDHCSAFAVVKAFLADMGWTEEVIVANPILNMDFIVGTTVVDILF